jgi:hypothetical protein
MKTSDTPNQSHSPGVSRRKFLATSGAAAAAFTIVPRQVLGGAGFVAPSEKVTVAYIGCGTQGLREMPDMLKLPEVQIVAVCDPVKESYDYVDWSKDGLRAVHRRGAGQTGLETGRARYSRWPRGRQGIIEAFYATQRGSEKFTGCAAYADFRELLEKEKDINAVKIMTPDHLHATIAIAAMKKGKHVMMHKPIANRLQEARLVIETARRTKVATHFLPASDGANIRQIKGWIDAGAIGTCGKFTTGRTGRSGPNIRRFPPTRRQSPRTLTGSCGWGRRWTGRIIRITPMLCSAAGMSSAAARSPIWAITVSGRSSPSSSWTPRSWSNHGPAISARSADHVAVRIKNDYSFPAACTIRFKFAAKGARPALDLFWYDGSMRPPTPEELEADNKELPAEGMMFVGDKGKVLAGFRARTRRSFLRARCGITRVRRNSREPSGRGGRARVGATQKPEFRRPNHQSPKALAGGLEILSGFGLRRTATSLWSSVTAS